MRPRAAVSPTRRRGYLFRPPSLRLAWLMCLKQYREGGDDSPPSNVTAALHGKKKRAPPGSVGTKPTAASMKTVWRCRLLPSNLSNAAVSLKSIKLGHYSSTLLCRSYQIRNPLIPVLYCPKHLLPICVLPSRKGSRPSRRWCAPIPRRREPRVSLPMLFLNCQTQPDNTYWTKFPSSSGFPDITPHGYCKMLSPASPLALCSFPRACRMQRLPRFPSKTGCTPAGSPACWLFSWGHQKVRRTAKLCLTRS